MYFDFAVDFDVAADFDIAADFDVATDFDFAAADFEITTLVDMPVKETESKNSTGPKNMLLIENPQFLSIIMKLDQVL